MMVNFDCQLDWIASQSGEHLPVWQPRPAADVPTPLPLWAEGSGTSLEVNKDPRESRGWKNALFNPKGRRCQGHAEGSGQTPLRVTVVNEKPTSSGAEAHTLLAGMENCTAITDGNIDIFKKLKVELSWNLATPLLGVFIQKIRLGSPSAVFTAVLSTEALVCAPASFPSLKLYIYITYIYTHPNKKQLRWHSRVWWEWPKSWSLHSCLTKIQPSWDARWPPCHLWFSSPPIVYLDDF